MAWKLARQYVENGLHKYSGQGLSQNEILYQICKDNHIAPRFVHDTDSAVISLHLHLNREYNKDQLSAMLHKINDRKKPRSIDAVIYNIRDQEQIDTEPLQPELFDSDF